MAQLRPYPTTEDKLMLSDKLKMEPHRIAKWFDNRRSRQRALPDYLRMSEKDFELEERRGKRGRRKLSEISMDGDLQAVVDQTISVLNDESARKAISDVIQLIPSKKMPDEMSSPNTDFSQMQVERVFRVLQQHYKTQPE